MGAWRRVGIWRRRVDSGTRRVALEFTLVVQRLVEGSSRLYSM